MRRFLLALALLGLAAPRVAHAQTASELVAARALYAEGIDLEKKKEYGPALEKFRRVASIKSTAIVRYHEGFCSEKLGHLVDALDAYAKAGIDGQGDPKQKDAVEAARKAEASLRPRVPKIHIKVTGTAKGKYDIKIDGVQVSGVLLDTAVPVDAGKHTVELSGEGIAGDSQEITVVEKETKEVVFAAQAPTADKPKDPITPPPKDPIKTPPPKDETKVVAPPPPPKEEPKTGAPRLAIVFSGAIGNIQPGGQIVDNTTTNLPTFGGRDGNVSSDQLNYFGSAPAFELAVGFRFLRPLHAYLFWQHGFAAGGSGFTKEHDVSATTDALGLGVGLLTHPNSMFSGYIDLAVSSRTLHFVDRTTTEDASLSGSNLRLKLGLAYKPTPTLAILGFGFVAAGSYSSFSYSAADRPAETHTDEKIDKTATHMFIGLGIGATYDLALAR
jgi:hypothetical protein